MKEIETKIIDIDEKGLRASLRRNKARYLGKVMYRRTVFDMAPDKEPGEDEFIRIRTDGKSSTLTYKRRSGRGLRNTDEIELSVSDYKGAVEIISRLWKGRRPYSQENTVEKWDYNGVEVDIVQWPLIPKLVEVEAKTEAQVKRAIKELKIKGKVVGNQSLWNIFKRYGQEGKDMGDLLFRGRKR